MAISTNEAQNIASKYGFEYTYITELERKAQAQKRIDEYQGYVDELASYVEYLNTPVEERV